MVVEGRDSLAHHTATANGVRLHYVEAGRGEPVVLLHGWPQTWREWRNVIPALASEHRVIAPDLRGLGDSERPAAGYDAVTLAADVGELLAGLGATPAHVVGHDLGGPVAYALAATRRDAVRTLALIECPLPGVGDPVTAIPATGEPAWHFAFHAARDIPEALVAGRERLYLTYFYRHFAYDPSAIGDDDIAEYARCYAAPGALRAGFEQYRAMPETAAALAELAKTPLDIPVLALGGAACLGDAVLASARRVAQDVRGGTVPRSGHWVAEERPDYLAEQLRAHFGRAAHRTDRAEGSS